MSHLTDTYLYCSDHGHVLIPESAEDDPTGEGLQQCECCACWFEVDPGTFYCDGGGDHDWDADLETCNACGLRYVEWSEPVIVDPAAHEDRCCS